MDRKFCKKHNNGEGAWITTSAFAKSKTSRDGFYTYCKECAKRALYEWREKNKEKLSTINKRWREQNPDILREGHRISKAKWRNRDLVKKAADTRKSHLKRAHGVTVEWFNAKSESQNHLCAICSLPPEPGRKLCIDHNHATGGKRGLLCMRCNTALERMETIPDWHFMALQYLKDYECLNSPQETSPSSTSPSAPSVPSE